MMRQPMPSPSIQHFCLSYVFFTLLPSPTNGRAHSWLSPSPAPLLSPLLNPVSAPPVPIAPSPTATKVIFVVQHHHWSRELIIAVSISSVAISAIALFIILLLVTWQRPKLVGSFKETQNYDYVTKGLHSGPALVAMMEYSTLKSATNNFDEKYILEEGRFGCVYQSCLNGVPAAIMKLDGCGRDHNELDLLGRIRHPNIVSLLGYCVHGETRFLVYDLLNNGSVHSQLHGSSHGSALTWPLRMKIALDTARGLEYLHEHCYPPVIHGDLKPSNILLDLDFNAKISGFGLAVSDADQNKCMAKSFGKLDYATPEYIIDGKLSEKSDVYAFGVVLLELLIGRKNFENIAPSQCQSLVTWATPLLTDRLKLPLIVDPVIRHTMDLKHLYQVAAVAVLCLQPDPSYRPLITDVFHSLIPLVPVELGGTLRLSGRLPDPNRTSYPY